MTTGPAILQNWRLVCWPRSAQSSTTTQGPPVATSADNKKYAAKILRRLKADYAEAECTLNFNSPLQLLLATILSAQCTDVRVNLITERLFKKYPSAAHFAKARQTTLEQDIKSTGFFRSKAKNIKACCQRLIDDYDGEVPPDLDSLVQLAGVGRKTASVVLGTAFGIASGVVVDTHVGRISRRLGLTSEKDAVKVERDLIEQLPRGQWIMFSHRMIHHGRKICDARKPKCEECSMRRFCPRIGVK